jgi:hypothetical protein
MLGFFAMCIIRMAPPYFEYLSVKDIISKLAVETDPEDANNAAIRRKIANVFNSNQIYKLSPKDVEVYRAKGKTYIDANYEVRLPILGRIDAVLNFDDLLYEVGNPEPITSAPPADK